MTPAPALRRWRDWFPIPTSETGFDVTRWVLLEAKRLAVAGALLTFVFIAFLLIGNVWTLEMQTPLTETSTAQTILNSLLSGMILLVSTVVSINSIVLSHDMSSVTNRRTAWRERRSSGGS